MLTIHPDIYDRENSLKQTIEILCDTKNAVTDDLTLNLVTKYFFAYFYPESVDQTIDIASVEKFRQDYDDYFKAKEIAFQRSNDFMLHKNPIHKFIYTHEYPITMLGDIAATTILVKDIAQRELSSALQANTYRWLDLGTGTGILLLAQYIQAMRNGYTSLQKIGIDNHPYAVRTTDKLIQKLWCGAAIYGDTTQKNTYLQLYGDSPIHHVSNETIPPRNSRMNTKSDPFFQNTTALYAVLDQYIKPETQFFPNRLDVRVHHSPFGQTMSCTPDNKFLHKELFVGQNYPEQQTTYIQEKIDRLKLSLIRCLQLEVCWEIVDPDKIGWQLIESGKVSPSTIHIARRRS
jgi:hypothetical protein